MLLSLLAVASSLPQDPSWNLLPDRAPAVRQAAFKAAADGEDLRWLAPLVDLLAFAETPEEWYRILDSAGAILGEDLRAMDRPWRNLTLRLASISDLPVFEDALGWKRELLVQRVDPRFAELLAPGSPVRVDMDEVVWGGVEVEGIPALVNPSTVSAAQADFMDPGEPVFGVWINGSARAYPQRILDWHEMANDVVGGVPVVLTYCTLCGAAVLYDRRLGERCFAFHSSGLLQRSNKLMFDKETGSLWNQLTGGPVIGPMAKESVRLKILPVVTTTWSRWRAKHPDSQVVTLETGHERDYQAGAAYGDYFRSPQTMFPAAGSRSGPSFEDKQRLVVVRMGARSAAFALRDLAAARAHNVEVGGSPVLLVVTERSGPDAVWPGWGDEPLPAAVRAYARGAQRFSYDPEEDLLRDADRGVWSMDEEALRGPAGQRLKRLPSHGLFGFAWHAFFAEGN